MVTFPEALDRALSAHYAVPGVKSMEARMNALVRLHGDSPGKAAASAGIPARTWRDWRSGKHTPSARGLRKLDAAYHGQVIAPKVARMVLSGKRPIRQIHAVANVVVDPRGRRYTNATERRVFRAEGIDTRRVATEWLASGPQAAADAYTTEILRAYGQEFAFEGDRADVELIT